MNVKSASSDGSSKVSNPTANKKGTRERISPHALKQCFLTSHPGATAFGGEIQGRVAGAMGRALAPSDDLSARPTTLPSLDDPPFPQRED